ncbi:MAG: chemotaxis protein CheC [Deltaproteobacteria bacterium]|nr:chemotaxis protein CheC [Deltaproteobacteria bacterium]
MSEQGRNLGREQRRFLERLCGAGGQQTGCALAAILGLAGDQVEWSEAGPVEVTALEVGPGLETERAVGVHFKLDAHLPGHLSLLLAEAAARALVERLLGPSTAVNGAGEFAPEAASALAEVANILTSAFLTPVADALRRSCIPSPPRLIHHRWPYVLRELRSHDDSGLVLGVALGARLHPPASPIAARILFAPNGILLEDLLLAARAGAG